MAFAVRIQELMKVKMGVFLRGRQAFMAEEFLDGPEVGAPPEEVGGERMAQGMGADPPLQGGPAKVFADEPLHGTGREPRALVVQEESALTRVLF